MFAGCKNLEVIPSFLFRYVNENTTSFEGTFERCEKLTSVPEELFENAPNATNFEETYAHCNSFDKTGLSTDILNKYFK